MKPYYEDGDVTLYHGRCEDVLPSFPGASAQVLLTDPPYFQVKDEDWDNQWDHVDEFLTWLGSVLDAAKPALTANASTWVFASPALTSAVEGVVRERFRMLNSVRWVKEAGWHQKADMEAQRRFLTPWEGIVFAEQLDSAYPPSAQSYRGTFAPFGRYLQQERERAGLSRTELELRIGYTYRNDPSRGSKLSYRWEEGSALPTAEAYQLVRGALGPGYLTRDYEDLRREYDALRRPFTLNRIGPTSDIWNFDPVAPYPGKHPCEKPAALLRHMIEVSSRHGDLIVDPFAGSGSTLIAARDAGRRAVGIEMDERWCERAARALSQGVFDFGGVA